MEVQSMMVAAFSSCGFTLRTPLMSSTSINGLVPMLQMQLSGHRRRVPLTPSKPFSSIRCSHMDAANSSSREDANSGSSLQENHVESHFNSSGENGDVEKGPFSLSQQVFRLRQAVAAGMGRYMDTLKQELQSEVGIDILELSSQLENLAQKLSPLHAELKRKLEDCVSQIKEVRDIFRLQYWPQFAAWNRWECWKDILQWDARRFGALVIYILLIAASVRTFHMIFIRPRIVHQLANSYMEAVIPEPNFENLTRIRKAMWQKYVPPGFRVERHVRGSNGELCHDMSFVGENPWDDGGEEASILTDDEKEALANMNSSFFELIRGKSADSKRKMSWQERLKEWDELLKLEDVKDYVLAKDSQYIIRTDADYLKKIYAKKSEGTPLDQPPLTFLTAVKWWQYRPKLPYLYFLSKVDDQEVESAVYTESLRQLFVRMRHGFPRDFMVDVPVDPYLYGRLKSSGVNIAVLSKSEWLYYLRGLAVLIPSFLILTVIWHVYKRGFEMTSERIIDLLKMDTKHLILPENAAEKAKSEYKDVVIGEEVWEVLEEIMHYMREPMRYYGRGVLFPRGILISGPPGTGKTLLARAIARESGLPFVFASGAEFVESSTGNGAEKVFNIFYTARANAPSFVFIDEIDALAGKGVNDDPERKSTFNQLLEELDGLPDDTDVDRFSLRQAVVLICATNRPDELHEDLMKPGRIDREIHIGLPGEKQRISIFAVHSSGRRFAKDVDFTKLVFRIVGYSGADIRNLINEAGIMAVRNKRSEICQQDFIDVLDKQLFEGLGMSMTKEEQKRAEEKVGVDTRRLLAVHEAGHVVVAHLFARYDWHALTHLLPAGKAHALSLFYPREEVLAKGYTTVGYLRMHMVVAHGGRCAERIVFGDDITDGGQEDLARISKLAREIAISDASPRLGLFPMVWKDKFDPPLPPDQTDVIPKNWSRPGNRIANMTMELSELFTREVTRYADETEEMAMKGLMANRHILDRVTDELFKRTNISGLEIEEMIKSMNPIMFSDPLQYPPMNLHLKEGDEDSDTVGEFKGFEELDIWQAPMYQL